MLIKDICSSITDGSHNPPQGIDTSSYLMLSSKNIFDDEITLDQPRFLSKEDFENENKRTKVKCGDVLLTIVGTVGRVAVVPNNLPSFTLQRSVAVLHPDEDVCSGRYLMYALRGKRSYIESHSKGVAQKGIYLKEVSGIDLPVPSKEVQEQIIEKLDKMNSIIKSRQLELEKLDELIKARFVEMFGDPVSNTKGWKRVTIDECVDSIENGKSFVCDSMARIGEEPAILKLSAATYGVYKPEENKAIINESDFIEGAEVHSGDLLFTRKNTPELVGMAAYVFMTPKKLMMPDLIFRINTKQNCRKIYLWKLINHELFRSQIQNLASGSAKSMSNISKERLGKLHIYLPPLDLQIEFEKFVIQINKSKVAVQKALDETQLLFDSLMQKYFG